MAPKGSQGQSEPSQEDVDRLWAQILTSAEDRLIALSPEASRRLRGLLRERMRQGDPRSALRECRAVLDALALEGRPRLVDAEAMDEVLRGREQQEPKRHEASFHVHGARPAGVTMAAAEVEAFPELDPPQPSSAPPPPDEPPRMATAPPPAPGAAPEADPPRSAYARLDAPEVSAAGVEFEVVVGLAAAPAPGVVGQPLVRPPSSVGAYTLSLQLVAEGFRLRDGETLRRSLPVTAAEPYPTTAFHLTAEPQTEKIRPRVIQAFYEIEGQTVGIAVRPMAVVRSSDLLGGAQPSQPAGVDVAVPTDAPAPDLEVRILEGADGLLWTFNTRHAGIDLPDKELRTSIGKDPQTFARLLVDRVNGREGRPGIYNFLSGIGQEIADAAPPELWSLLRAAAEAAGGPPSVLILSQEPYVPWELAKIEEPLFDDTAPPFLAAQANVGRWVLSRQESGPRQRPRQPPPTEVAVHSAAVVSGVYNRPGWNRLREAEAEAADLQASLPATAVLAAAPQVLDCLAGTPPADLLHFAVHGIYDPNGLQDGLMLTDGEVLDPFEVSGTTLRRSPFVFLNACQVGSGSKILGDYSGMASAFLKAGASGVVAPLWSVKDTIARQIAEDFYKAMAAGSSPAEALRLARKGFQVAATPQSATYLAYQFFGHPALKIRF